MKPLNCRALVCVLAVAVSAISSTFAQTATPPPSVDVAAVRFKTANGGWYETEIEVQGRPGSAIENRNFINRVKVTLNLGIFSVKAPDGAKIPDTYYRASAEAVAIEATGGRTVFRFYLPPEIVKRDQISGPQRFYLVELAVAGQPLPLTKNHFPVSTFATPDIVESFRSKVASEASSNEGVLLPQHLTPFAFNGASPSFIRVETTR